MLDRLEQFLFTRSTLGELVMVIAFCTTGILFALVGGDTGVLVFCGIAVPTILVCLFVGIRRAWRHDRDEDARR